MRKYEYYDTPDDGDYDGYGTHWFAQTSTPDATHLLAKVKLKFFRVGDPGTITVSIKNTTDGKPSGADLCKGTIEGTDITENEDGEWYEITLGSGYTVTKNVQYAIVVRAPNGAADKKLSWRADVAGATYPGGTVCTSTNSGTSWGIISASDFMFEEWGVGEPSPTAIVWGNLLKSQIDAEKIEDAILRLIVNHLDDPDAHVLEGQSLYSHKAAEIIDHLAASIIADKIKEWESLKISGTLERNDFHWWTMFESINGYAQYFEGSGNITLDPIRVEVETGATINSVAKLRKYTYLLDVLSWNKRRKVRISFQIRDSTNQTIYMGSGDYWAGENRNFVGFKIVNNALYGVVNNGAGETLLNLGVTVSTSTIYMAEVVFVPGEYAEFFWQGVSKGKISADLPSGTSYASYFLCANITNAEAVDKRLWIHFWDFWLEI